MDYFFHIFTLFGIYTVLSISLDLLAGQTRLLALSHAAFYGLGAYTSSLMSIHFSFSFFTSVSIGVAIAALSSLFVSLPSLRLHKDYFVITTFGFQMILFSIFNNWIEVTRGPLGVTGIPQPRIFYWTIQSPFTFAILSSIFATFAYVIVSRLSSSPFGRALRAIREDEIFAQSLGKNTLRFKVTAFAVSAGLAASAGSLYAHYITYIDPTSFSITESVLVISMVIVGGAGSKWGPLVGAAVLVSLPEALRFLGFPGSVAANLRQIIYGVLLVVIMMARPYGLAGRPGFKW